MAREPGRVPERSPLWCEPAHNGGRSPLARPPGEETHKPGARHRLDHAANAPLRPDALDEATQAVAIWTASSRASEPSRSRVGVMPDTTLLHLLTGHTVRTTSTIQAVLDALKPAAAAGLRTGQARRRARSRRVPAARARDARRIRADEPVRAELSRRVTAICGPRFGVDRPLGGSDLRRGLGESRHAVTIALLADGNRTGPTECHARARLLVRPRSRRTRDRAPSGRRR
jgi:hypothetical protein